MKAIIEIDIPDFQIGQEVSIYFKDTMMIKGTVQEPTDDRCHYCEHNFTPYKGNTGEFEPQERSDKE